jgi:hypothetical protein
MTKNLKIKKFIFEKSKVAVYYPQTSIKDVEATWEAFSPQKRTSSASKHDGSGPQHCPSQS